MSLSPSIIPNKKSSRQLPPESEEEDEEEGEEVVAPPPSDDEEEKDEFDKAIERYDELTSAAQDFFSDEDWEYVAPGTPMSWITEQRNLAAIVAMNEKLEERIQSRKDTSAQGNSDAEMEDDEDDEEEGHVEPAMVDPSAEQIEAPSAPGHESIVEEKCTLYSSVPYGVNPAHIVHAAEELMEFETAEEMNEMLNSKSPDRWQSVRTKHIWVLRNNDRNTQGWWEGKPDAPKRDELDYEMFYYICCYVKPTADDPESTLKAECDKRVLRHLHRQVAVKLHERFDKAIKSVESREQKKLILSWKPASVPQVEPRVVGWVPYRNVVLATAFTKRESNPRVKGSQAKRGPGVIKPPVPKGGFTKRSADELDDDDDDDDDEASGASTQLLEAAKKGLKTDCDFFAPNRKAGFKRHRTFVVANGAATQVYIIGNVAHIVEH